GLSHDSKIEGQEGGVFRNVDCHPSVGRLALRGGSRGWFVLSGKLRRRGLRRKSNSEKWNRHRPPSEAGRLNLINRIDCVGVGGVDGVSNLLSRLGYDLSCLLNRCVDEIPCRFRGGLIGVDNLPPDRIGWLHNIGVCIISELLCSSLTRLNNRTCDSFNSGN